ncbi:unnamed protein product [Colias eurytheme]|nr:unnamed protein product [Colias eurytheme]
MVDYHYSQKENQVSTIPTYFLVEVREPSDEFKKFSRMSLNDFEYLLLRKAIPARIRLVITLRYLATGDDFISLHYLFKVSPQIISEIIAEVCHALCEVLKDEIKIPSCPEEWLRIERGFARKFPRAVGSIDGKHIVLDCPFNSGSAYYNYKRTFSIVLLAFVDNVHKQLKFTATASFALSEHLMKPYSGQHNKYSEERKFNTKLSSGRVVVENTFGLLAARFRVFRKPIPLQPEKSSLITHTCNTCILLHNFLRRSSTSLHIYTPPGSIDMYDDDGVLIQPGSWRTNQDNTSAIRNLRTVPRRPANSAIEIRKEFTKYVFK